MTGLSTQFSRFVAIGAFATALQYCVLVILVQTGSQDAVTASNIGFCLSALANYAMNRKYTFRSAANHARAFPKFVAVMIVGLAINSSLMWIGHIVLAINYLVAQLGATFATLIWNFTVHRFWTFRASSSLTKPRPRSSE
jgi:putative flippase GtrA